MRWRHRLASQPKGADSPQDKGLKKADFSLASRAKGADSPRPSLPLSLPPSYPLPPSLSPSFPPSLSPSVFSCLSLNDLGGDALDDGGDGVWAREAGGGGEEVVGEGEDGRAGEELRVVVVALVELALEQLRARPRIAK